MASATEGLHPRPVSEITQATRLLDARAITQAEFDALKSAVLSRS